MTPRKTVFSVALLLAGCGKGVDDVSAGVAQAAAPACTTEHTPVQAATEPPTATPKPGAGRPAGAAAAAVRSDSADGKPTLDVHITVHADGMVFDVTKITAAAGQTVHVVLENKTPGILAHNFALVKPGTEAAVAAAGLKQGAAAGWLAEGPDVFAHSEMVQPGKTGELSFAAPSVPGNYPYICTFPGHYMMMKGVLEVTP